MTNVIQLFENSISAQHTTEGTLNTDTSLDLERQEQPAGTEFPLHVLLLTDFFADAGDIELAFRILDGYEAHGEPYIEALYEHIQSRQSQTPLLHRQQGNLFDPDLEVSQQHM